jgi:hypothetical protein
VGENEYYQTHQHSHAPPIRQLQAHIHHSRQLIFWLPRLLLLLLLLLLCLHPCCRHLNPAFQLIP